MKKYKQYSNHELKVYLLKYYKQHNKTPRMKDFNLNNNLPSSMTYVTRFGSWNNALKLIGLKVNMRKNYTKEELIKILQRLYLKLNRTPTREELTEFKEYPSLTPFVEKFGSYTAACLRAGLIPNDGRNNSIWKNWQKHCEKMAKVIYGKIETQKNNLVEGRPDIYIQNKNLFIDAKTCGYRDFKKQIEKYCKNNHNLEFWLIFKGIETKRKNVKYIYSEDLAKIMNKLGRRDLASKCHQFIRNIFSEDQKTLQ